MSLSSTVSLKCIIGLLGLAVAAILVFVIPFNVFGNALQSYRPILLGLYVTAIPFFIAIYHLFNLLGNIDNGQTFSADSVARLKTTKICGLVISGLFTLSLPYLYYVADTDDALGLIIVGLMLIAGSFIVATVAALLHRLLQNAVDIKSENDLTV